MRTAAWLLALAMALGPAGCRKRPEPCVVTGVTVEEGPGPFRMQATGIDREDLRRIALDAFARTPGFEVPAGEPRKGSPRCRGLVSLVDARLAPGGPGAQVEVLLRMDAIPADEADPVSETVRASEQVAPGEARAASFRRAIQGGAVRAASALALALGEARKPDAEVIRDLEAGDARLRELAVGVLADRKNPAAVPGLVARLQDPDADVADRAVGALAQIGDPRGVGPIIELSRRREGPFVAQMVRAVGDIGGPEAEAYLDTMATGHPDPLVSEAAREALRGTPAGGERLARRGAEPEPGRGERRVRAPL